jgi:wyosine [tRNA(Phe)-imidazoG37] synthetase (radical SAM superfamily)
MDTFLFDKIVFGPVKSRRLGSSLGINLLPLNKKVCNFNCIYCECGDSNAEHPYGKEMLPYEHIINTMMDEFKQLKNDGIPVDAITFAGNGEPTLHPDFPRIIDKTIELRDQYFSHARIAVLSNSTTLNKPKVFDALEKVDMKIMKIDAGTEKMCKLINRPNRNFDLNQVIKDLKSFKGDLIIQTLFLRGWYREAYIDNTSEEELAAWLNILHEIKPQLVMIYTFHRATPVQNLEKVTLEELEKIAQQVNKMGIETQISG